MKILKPMMFILLCGIAISINEQKPSSLLENDTISEADITKQNIQIDRVLEILKQDLPRTCKIIFIIIKLT